MAHNKALFCGSRRLGTSKKAGFFLMCGCCYHIIMRNFLFPFIVEKNFEENFGPWILSRLRSLTLLCVCMSNDKSDDFSAFHAIFETGFESRK